MKCKKIHSLRTGAYSQCKKDAHFGDCEIDHEGHTYSVAQGGYSEHPPILIERVHINA